MYFPGKNAQAVWNTYFERDFHLPSCAFFERVSLARFLEGIVQRVTVINSSKKRRYEGLDIYLIPWHRNLAHNLDIWKIE
jgi:hypothetical protein